MGLKTLLGIKKRRWEKSIEKFVVEMKARFPGYDWEEFRNLARHFWRREMSSLPEHAYLFRLARDLPPDARVVEAGGWN